MKLANIIKMNECKINWIKYPEILHSVILKKGENELWCHIAITIGPLLMEGITQVDLMRHQVDIWADHSGIMVSISELDSIHTEYGTCIHYPGMRIWNESSSIAEKLYLSSHAIDRFKERVSMGGLPLSKFGENNFYSGYLLANHYAKSMITRENYMSTYAVYSARGESEDGKIKLNKIGYMPVVKHGNAYVAKTFLVPGFSNTPEESLMLDTPFNEMSNEAKEAAGIKFRDSVEIQTRDPVDKAFDHMDVLSLGWKKYMIDSGMPGL